MLSNGSLQLLILLLQILAALLQPLGVCAAYLNPEVAGVSVPIQIAFLQVCTE